MSAIMPHENPGFEPPRGGERKMAISINTNLAAAVAVQNLNKTNKLLNSSQLNIATGLRVNGPKDDASTYAIAQNQRGDVVGFKAIRSALASGEFSSSKCCYRCWKGNF